MRSREVVVGTDGTAASQAAVRWAAREAARRHATLRIVHVFDRQWPSPDVSTEDVDVDRRLAEAVAATALEQARTVRPGLDAETETLPGRAVPRLLEAAGAAGLLVLGSRAAAPPRGCCGGR